MTYLQISIPFLCSIQLLVLLVCFICFIKVHLEETKLWPTLKINARVLQLQKVKPFLLIFAHNNTGWNSAILCRWDMYFSSKSFNKMRLFESYSKSVILTILHRGYFPQSPQGFHLPLPSECLASNLFGCSPFGHKLDKRVDNFKKGKLTPDFFQGTAIQNPMVIDQQSEYLVIHLLSGIFKFQEDTSMGNRVEMHKNLSELSRVMNTYKNINY